MSEEFGGSWCGKKRRKFARDAEALTSGRVYPHSYPVQAMPGTVAQSGAVVSTGNGKNSNGIGNNAAASNGNSDASAKDNSAASSTMIASVGTVASAVAVGLMGALGWTLL